MQDHTILREGPGVWWSLHASAVHAKTPAQLSAVYELINTIRNHFFCLDCRQHFRENSDAFPPPKHNNHYALFNWTVEMHNKVNRRNGKREYSPSEVLKKYINENGESAFCSDCGGTEAPKNPVVDAITTSPKYYPRMTVGGR